MIFFNKTFQNILVTDNKFLSQEARLKVEFQAQDPIWITVPTRPGQNGKRRMDADIFDAENLK